MTEFKIIRRGRAEAYVEPASIRLRPESFAVPDPGEIARGRLWAPAGWNVDVEAPLAWIVSPLPDVLSPDRPATIRLDVEYADGSHRSFRRRIAVALELDTTFTPSVHAFPERNSASAIGEYGPTPGIFIETFIRLGSRPSSWLYDGLYADIVQLRHHGSHRGGLCSGMARWAGLRALDGERILPDHRIALRQIMVLHGRQLTDRAILSSFRWFLRASPSAAYRAFRDEALSTGESLRAFDVGVPKPWRRDLPKALVREGHTIVPYRIRQPSADRAYVDCYDPNRGSSEAHTIEFHLNSDRYTYRNKVSLDQSNVGLIAVSHVKYTTRGTAVIATIGSVIWNLFRIGRPSER